jgi:hypothetical protein
MIRYLTIFNLFLFLFLKTTSLFSQNDLLMPDARSMAVAGAGITFADHWACFHNQAALAFAKKPSIGIYAENRYNIKELNSGAIALAIPLKNLGSFGVSYYVFNNSSIYTRQKVSLAYAKLLGKSFSAGVQFDLLYTSVSNYENNLSFCGELGILYKIHPKWEIGVHVFNLTGAKYQKYEKEQIPTIMTVGVGWHISENTLVVAEVENNTYSNITVRGGIEYEISKKVAFQLGMRSNPWINSFGFSYKAKNLRINIGLEYHQLLGISPGVSIDKYFGSE